MPKASSHTELDNIRHSLAHLLAAAVLKKFPKAKLGIGPTIENGFYYDFLLPRALEEKELREFEKTMRELINQKLPIKGGGITPQKAKTMWKGQPFKLDLIKEFISQKKKLTAYATGDVFTDLCKGGHVKNTGEIPKDAFALTKVAGAYWRGDEKNPQLTRIYGLAFNSKQDLETHLKFLEEAERRDHKKLGPKLDLFTFSDLVGSGLPLWTPKGTLLRNLLDTFVWELRRSYGYQKVEIPHITKKDLYEKSGHWEKFKDELFRINSREGHEFAMKPMNCPHHTQIYARKQWSYRELPQRYANTTMVYRDEQSGELGGLPRTRAFTQDDAHVFCRMSQVKNELLNIWDIIHTFYPTVGLKLNLRLSFHDPKEPKKYLGDKKKWQEAEKIIREIAEKKNTPYVEAPGEAAFYGPKLDFLTKDALGREWQIATIQLDMVQPERFDLTCINETGEKERIVMIHAAIMGSIERFLSVVIEHYAGAFPVWLAPVQVVVLPVSDKFSKYGEKIIFELASHGVRTEMPPTNETLGKRIREAEMQKVPYILVVGEKEEQSNSVSIRARGSAQNESGEMKLEVFLKKIKEEIDSKKQ